MQMEKRVALVTGGSRGIGRAVCLKLAQDGVNVIVNYAGNTDAAAETAAQCRAYGVQSICVQGDVSDPEACDRLFAEAAEFCGQLDILVCSAGITRDQILMRMKEEDFLRVMQVNLNGTFHCLKRASRIMLRQRYGRIITISSVVGLHGNSGQVNYAASKAGVIGMTKSLAKEVASRNITVNAIAPGWIDTDMSAAVDTSARSAFMAQIPMGYPGKPEDVAHAVSFLAHPASGYITGQVLCVDGGMAM